MAKKKGMKIKIKDEIKDEESLLDAEDQPETEADEFADEVDSDDEKEPIPVDEALDDDSIPVDEKLELVKAAWDASERKAVEYLEGWQREKAEFSNYKKRVNRDREQFQKDSVGRVVRNYLPIIDDLERALKDRPQNGEGQTWAEGIELIYRKMVNILENDGVTPIEAAGEMFDPNLHEAVARVPSPAHESDQIIDVLQTGYMVGDRVLRPTRVAIAE